MQPTTHRHVTVNGIDIFYREAGPETAPVVLLPHGYPCSSYEFRNLMPGLADRWRLLAPDFPGAGYSATPDDFDCSFDGYASLLDGFVKTLGVQRFFISMTSDLPLARGWLSRHQSASQRSSSKMAISRTKTRWDRNMPRSKRPGGCPFPR